MFTREPSTVPARRGPSGASINASAVWYSNGIPTGVAQIATNRPMVPYRLQATHRNKAAQRPARRGKKSRAQALVLHWVKIRAGIVPKTYKSKGPTPQ